MVDLPRNNILGIASFAKLQRTCKSFVSKCSHNKKSPYSKEPQVDGFDHNQPNNYKNIFEDDHRELERKIMNGSSLQNSFRSYNHRHDHHHHHQTNPNDNKNNNSTYKHKSNHNHDDFTSTSCFPSSYFSCSRPLSRNSSVLSRKSSTDNSSPSPPFVPKTSPGRRISSNDIMFSNSSGVLKPPAIERKLECTLEDLCYGCQKKVKITRDIVKNTGIVVQEEVLTIVVQPGWKKGTKITFEGMGNEKPGLYPADITFVISEKRHEVFKRKGNDLEMAMEIPLVQALTGCDISVPLLGGDVMSLNIVDDIIFPGFETVVQGQGMPLPKDHVKRGNLKLTFHVVFPKNLTLQQRLDVATILQGSC